MAGFSDSPSAAGGRGGRGGEVGGDTVDDCVGGWWCGGEWWSEGIGGEVGEPFIDGGAGQPSVGDAAVEQAFKFTDVVLSPVRDELGDRGREGQVVLEGLDTENGEAGGRPRGGGGGGG